MTTQGPNYPVYHGICNVYFKGLVLINRIMSMSSRCSCMKGNVPIFLLINEYILHSIFALFFLKK
jgi:hypothetical protein